MPLGSQRSDRADAGIDLVLAEPPPKRQGHGLPEREPGEGAREMEHDAPRGDLHPRPELEEPLAERGHLERGRRGAGEPRPEPLEQHVGGGREEHAEGGQVPITV